MTGVKAFPHPPASVAKASAAHDLSVTELEAVRELAHQRMVAGGYSPYR